MFKKWLWIKASAKCINVNVNKGEDHFNLMFVVHRKCLSEEQKARSSWSVFVSAVFSSADCCNSAVCVFHLREKAVTNSHQQPDWRKREDTKQIWADTEPQK